MKLSPLFAIFLAAPVAAFVRTHSCTRKSLHSNARSRSSLRMAALSPGDPVMLIGPGFLQLVVAKALKAAGLRPLVVAPQAKLDRFVTLVNDDEIMNDSTIGMPEVGEPYFGEIAGVIFCGEDAVLGPNLIPAVLDYTDKGQSAFVDGGLKKVLCCAPMTKKIQKEKSMGWIPVFQKSEEQNAKIWKTFVDAYEKHPKSGPVIRYGSLFGGSIDGPDFLSELGLDEGMYKMSLEQYRDMRERAFDRYRLGVQLLEGDSVNPQPPNQEKMEKEGINKSEEREAFRMVGGYPEVDRANRHSVAQTVLQALLRDEGLPKEMTVLSKASMEFPTREEWDALFSKMGPSPWPDPYAFDPAAHGVGQTSGAK